MPFVVCVYVRWEAVSLEQRLIHYNLINLELCTARANGANSAVGFVLPKLVSNGSMRFLVK